MTEVRTFRAGTMQEALAVVRQEFGSEAVILHTRQKAATRLWPWSRRAAEVEVTAGRDVLTTTTVTHRSSAVAAAARYAPCGHP